MAIMVTPQETAQEKLTELVLSGSERVAEAEIASEIAEVDESSQDRSREEKTPQSVERHRLISVANRLPCTIHKDKDTGKWVASKSSGGLVSALSGVSGIDMNWIGWPGCEVPDEDKEEVAELVGEQGCYPVFLTDSEIELYYNGFCNNTLWPLFHYITPSTERVIEGRTLEWETYQQANAKFVDAIMKVLHDDDLVWVHDYHLMLVPKLLRERVPNANIGWFLHTPFPSAEIYRMLPQREEILQGLLSANLLAFHVHDYVRHFLSCCVQLTTLEITPQGVDATPLNGNFVKCATIPIGIDPTPFTSTAESVTVAARVASLKEQWGDRKVILGIDRLDYIKGIPHKLRAFDMFLDEHPEWASQCVLVQLAIPTRSEVPEYQRLKRQVHEMVGSICGKHSNLYTGPPVIYLDGCVDHEELTALYRVADVALISSIRDGMNLVAYEFVASQQHKNGVLVISEFAGAAQYLGAGSIRINPWNLEEVSWAIYEALTMGEDRRKEMHDYCFKYIHNHSAQRWAETFIATLKSACSDRKDVSASVSCCNSVFIRVFGHSGFPSLPAKLYQSLMSVPKDLMASLQRLANDENTIMVVTTSHSKQIVERLLGHLPIYLLPENGCIYRNPEGVWKYADALACGCITEDNSLAEVESTVGISSPQSRSAWSRADTSDGGWMNGAEEVLRYFQERTPGSYIDRTEFSLKWFFDNTQTDFGAPQTRDLMIQLWAGPLANADAEIVVGNRYIEIRPKDSSIASNLDKILHYEILEADPASDSKVDTCVVIGAYPFRDEDVYQVVEDTLVRQWLPKYTRHQHGCPTRSVSSSSRQSSSDCIMDIMGCDALRALGNSQQLKPMHDDGKDSLEYESEATATNDYAVVAESPTARDSSRKMHREQQLDSGALTAATSASTVSCLDESSTTESMKETLRQLHDACYSIAVGQCKVSKAKYSIPNTYYVANLVHDIATHLPQSPLAGVTTSNDSVVAVEHQHSITTP
ncbi:conserved hypothetical protein [Perkinsus marinus ATCC 50983]|uniref:Uncharacterized protein n=1 Tax=Perkinsus marinus (strain ATCC 50983 / TXsc) TaxID=423536 RepID=C5KFL4_PERM5|nr:conserved hypothetical protein [Perkinsus marinus ATCC 50983]EER16763.1 conserved hypothetical protein [Perkinsus marinus ATCC 50983]|eukprot:XP_002784967.1 conserved hypothetical protein [Perkinsus marinus ATCC 50983]